MKRINISSDVVDVQWIYGFPTCGKTTAQRTIRFLTSEQRRFYNFENVIDASDTDEWFGTFKKSQNPKDDELSAALDAGVKMTNRLLSDHTRVVFTNMWNCLAKADIAPLGIFLPRDVSSVKKRVEARGDLHPEWIYGQAADWMEHIRSSAWFQKYEDRVVYLEADKYILDFLDINNKPIQHRFDRQHAVKPIGDASTDSSIL